MEGQNKFQNERRRRRIGNAIFGHDKQKVGTIPFPVCVSTSMKHSVMDSISPASQEPRGPPAALKSVLYASVRQRDTHHHHYLRQVE